MEKSKLKRRLVLLARVSSKTSARFAVLCVLLHELLVESSESFQHVTGHIWLRQNCGAEVECAFLLSKS